MATAQEHGTIRNVLFDFSGTLFRIETAVSWLRAALAAVGTGLPEEELRATAAALERAGALPGGPPPDSLPPALAAAWAVRDRSITEHRTAYTAAARRVPLPHPDLHEALYERHMTPEAWLPYPDAAVVLGGLRQHGIRVGVVSNIGWDLRPVFLAHGLDPLVDTYTLSFEHGMQKPEAGLFEAACATLGAEPATTLMVGDDRRADGGAAALGCAVHFVDPLPVAERPAGLLPVLDRAVGGAH
ncbi:HAD family hydrolase [Streptomyces sp. NPDC058045]|uniref:HAD family hydrolase n=1 Tax=Streptomyces sp. NPDC058045 TaxID=3346311 RepID=UPI0036EFBBDA